MNRLKIDKLMRIIVIVLLLLQTLFVVVYNINQPKKNYNYQKELTFAQDKIINYQTYFQDDKLIADFVVKDNRQQMDKDYLYPTKKFNLLSPLKYDLYLLNDVGVDNNGDLEINLQEYTPISSGFIESGINELLYGNDIKEIKKHKYILINIKDVEAPNGQELKSNFIIMNTKNIYEYINILDYFDDNLILPDDKKEKMRVEKWIFMNEFNNNLVNTFISNNTKIGNITSKNCIEKLNLLLDDYNAIELKIAETQTLLGDNVSQFLIDYPLKNYLNIKNAEAYNDYKDEELRIIDNEINRYLLGYETDLYEKNDNVLVEEYDDSKDKMTKIERIKWLQQHDCTPILAEEYAQTL